MHDFDGSAINPWTAEGLSKLKNGVEYGTPINCMKYPFRGSLQKATTEQVRNDPSEA